MLAKKKSRKQSNVLQVDESYFKKFKSYMSFGLALGLLETCMKEKLF